MVLTKESIELEFARWRGEHDAIREPSHYHDRLTSDGEVIIGLAELEFCYAQHSSAVSFTVYGDGTFRVGQAGCAMDRDSIAAYHRAWTFIFALELEDAK